ncbi:sigma-70 family RNA polymerase sigma factor [Occallatibacter riparius]|uniref:Sigma-70 family RNA polymerase sigma factor n=1 Tax=Occallatibacter riparius TaxID=1002689 RepID=A0A9J7BUW0_9BACT|nr:sigma-70 family RNA polymerase sigma factor [Occallatibacter riparius]UWZ86353.1 sigma-70 family RNA polymerase sigma factor [Occallatibacter riparius]
MDQNLWLADEFEASRGHLRGVAYRMLGSLAEAEDAVQETWLRLSRSGAEGIDNLRAWLTTVVSRVCLDMLRSRTAHREEPLEPNAPTGPATHASTHPNPEQEALLADSVGIALLVVLDRLNPAERLAFVLHDLFDFSFEEIARIVSRTPEAARQLASRARRRVRGAAEPTTQLAQQRELVGKFLTALRAGNVEGLLDVLDPDVVVRIDAASAFTGQYVEVHGASTWAGEAVKQAKGARYAHPALINGDVGLVIAPRGRLFRLLRFAFRDERISEVQVVGNRTVLDTFELSTLDEGGM